MAFLNSGTLPTEAPCTSNTPPQLPRRSKPDFSYQSVHVAHSACGKTPESHSYNLCASVDRNKTVVRSPIVPLLGTHERTFVSEYPKDHGTEFPCRGNCGGLAALPLLDAVVVVGQSFPFRAQHLVMRRFDEHVAQPRRAGLRNSTMTDVSTRGVRRRNNSCIAHEFLCRRESSNRSNLRHNGQGREIRDARNCDEQFHFFTMFVVFDHAHLSIRHLSFKERERLAIRCKGNRNFF